MHETQIRHRADVLLMSAEFIKNHIQIGLLTENHT